MPNTKVLDLGCGSGELLRILQQEKNIEGYGIDNDINNKFEFENKNIKMTVKKYIPSWWGEGCDELSSNDPIMKSLINKFNDCKLSSIRNPFYSLCKSIVGQQISVAAASAVWDRLENKYNIFDGQFFKSSDLSQLKKIGLSALAGSLVAFSAANAEITMSGGASVGVSSDNDTRASAYYMADSINFTLSGETDNGLTITQKSFIMEGLCK